MKRLWVLLFFFLLILFRKAFQTYIFKDDFYLFAISRASNWNQFLGLFYPLKPYGFYRPLGIEVFYFLAGLINNLAVVRLAVFALFFAGLIFLYKNILLLFKDKRLALLTVFMYSVSFTHVYQLYWLATFQEIAVFTFCAAAFYFFWRQWFGWCWLFYLLALLSREEAMVLPWLLVLLLLVFSDLVNSKHWQQWRWLFFLTLPFFLLYRINFAAVAIRPEYHPYLNLRLMANNGLWYSLWSLGLSSFFPDFVTSIFKLPTQELVKAIVNTKATNYLVLLAVYWTSFLAVTVRLMTKKTWRTLFICASAFLIYVLPMSVILHKWMVRLTIPLIFLVFFQAYMAVRLNKILAFFLISVYVWYNFLAVPVEETSSTYILETKISQNVKNVMENNHSKLVDSQVIYFADNGCPNSTGWQGSQKIKLTLSDQEFLHYYFPGQKIRALYGFEQSTAPQGSFTTNCTQVLPN